MAAYECCCLLAHGMFALHTSTTAAAADSLARTLSEPAFIAGLLSCQCFRFTARTEARAKGRASYGELSAGARRHPCISLALVRFVPSQWAAPETWACRSGEISMAQRAVALLAMGFGRIGQAMAEKGLDVLDLAPRKRAIARPSWAAYATHAAPRYTCLRDFSRHDSSSLKPRWSAVGGVRLCDRE